MKNILYIHPYNTTFIRRDKALLLQKYKLIDLDFSRGCSGINGRLKQIGKIVTTAHQADLSYIWFADFSAFISVIWGKIIRKPVVVIIGGYELANLPQYNYGALQTAFSAWRVKVILRLATRILVVDKSLQSDAESLMGGKQKNFQTVATGYDADKFTPSGKKENFVLTVAAVRDIDKARLKGLETFIKSANEMPETRFIIIGLQGAALDWAKSLAPKNLEVVSHISENELIQYYQKAKVYCQLSCREGLPNALCEAMLCECVPVGTKANGIPTAIGETGFYAEFGNVYETTQAIHKALESNLGAEARERLQQLFPQSRRAQELDKILSELLCD